MINAVRYGAHIVTCHLDLTHVISCTVRFIVRCNRHTWQIETKLEIKAGQLIEKKLQPTINK